MTTVKNTLLASAMVILGANASASSAIYGDYSLHSRNKTIKAATTETKAAAYELGLEKLNLLKANSGAELSNEFALSLGSYKEKNSVTLDDGAYITVQEMMNAQGQVVYTSLVNITCSYSQAN